MVFATQLFRGSRWVLKRMQLRALIQPLFFAFAKHKGNSLKTITHAVIVLATAGAAAFLSTASAEAQTNYTYIWGGNAQGQEYQQCPDVTPSYWPSNSLWSESLNFASNCDNSASVVSAPSNWDPADTNTPALGLGVYPGGPGATNVNVILAAPANTILDVANVTLNTLTLQTDGALTNNGTLTASNIDLQGDGSITGGSGFGGALTIASGGSLTKSGGDGTFSFGTGTSGVTLSGDNCSLIVQSGTLEMPFDNGNGGTFYNATMAVSNGASVVLQAPDNDHFFGGIGTLTGTGPGTVFWNQGSIWSQGWDLNGAYHEGLTLDFPGNMLQWSGGCFAGGGIVTNIGVVNITNAGAVNEIHLFNDGLVNLAPGSLWSFLGNSYLQNQSDGSVFLLGDGASITGGSKVSNYGLIRKTAGTGTSFINPQFWDYAGTVEVDSGTLALNLSGDGNYFTNALFVVSNAAALDLMVTDVRTEVEGSMTASGGGTVLMNNGTLFCSYPTTLNFPGAMFQWQGGNLGGNSPDMMVNAGAINLSGAATINGYLDNSGTVVQSGAGGISGGSDPGQFQNNAGAIYNIQNDNNLSAPSFYNYGLLEKTAGTGTNSINAFLYNYGSITAVTGGLNFGGSLFDQNAGTFQLTPAFIFNAPNQTINLNGGTIAGVGTLGGNAPGDNVEVYGGALIPGNPFGAINVPCNFQIWGGALNIQIGGTTQFCQLAASSSVYIGGGTLNVSIAGSYAPAIGTQFNILSCPNFTGPGFATLNVPQGISVTYSNTGVYLTVTGAVPAQITGAHVSGANFMFSVATAANQSYSVYANTNLATTDWTFYTNLTGDGNLWQVVVPAQNPPQRFFRVSEP